MAETEVARRPTTFEHTFRTDVTLKVGANGKRELLLGGKKYSSSEATKKFLSSDTGVMKISSFTTKVATMIPAISDSVSMLSSVSESLGLGAAIAAVAGALKAGIDVVKNTNKLASSCSYANFEKLFQSIAKLASKAVEFFLGLARMGAIALCKTTTYAFKVIKELGSVIVDLIDIKGAMSDLCGLDKNKDVVNGGEKVKAQKRVEAMVRLVKSIAAFTLHGLNCLAAAFAMVFPPIGMCCVIGTSILTLIIHHFVESKVNRIVEQLLAQKAVEAVKGKPVNVLLNPAIAV